MSHADSPSPGPPRNGCRRRPDYFPDDSCGRTSGLLRRRPGDRPAASSPVQWMAIFVCWRRLPCAFSAVRGGRHQQDMQKLVEYSRQPTQGPTNSGRIHLAGGKAALIAGLLDDNHHLFTAEVGFHSHLSPVVLARSDWRYCMAWRLCRQTIVYQPMHEKISFI